MRNSHRYHLAPLLLILATTVLSSGCVTHRDIDRVSADELEMLPEGAEVVVTTTDDREIRIKVTGAGPGYVEGVDRHFQQHRLEREEIQDIRGRPQNDLVVALAFFAVVFVTGF